MEKSPSCPENHRRRHWPFCRGKQKFPERGSVCQLKQGSLSSLRAAGRPCGPALGFLRARCSWSTLNKGNSNVTATVNLRGCSCQQDVPNQSRNNPTSNTHTLFFFCFFLFSFPPSPNFPRITKRAHRREGNHCSLISPNKMPRDRE